jgi:hypothetical protein
MDLNNLPQLEAQIKIGKINWIAIKIIGTL